MKNIYLSFIFLFFLYYTLNAANILSNPGFENGNAWWNFQANAGASTVDYASTEAHTGSYACHINVTQAAPNNYQIQLNTPSNWTAETGKKYRLVFYAKADKALAIHVAAQDGPPGYGYRAGSDFSLSTQWKQIEYIYTSDVNGEGALRFNIFVGTTVANYYFDDFSLEVVTDVKLPAPTPPTQGAFYTDQYRNMFLELGKDPAAIENKVNTAFLQLFYGDPNTEALYFETGDDMAYIKDIASNDIRSEGMSYGMMIAVQLNKKEEFDRLWKFAKTYMQHQSGPRAGYFAWSVSTTDFAHLDPNSAPDGEEYFAMALFFAAHRWGNGEGIFNYKAEALQLLNDMLHLETRNNGVVDGLTNMFNKTRKQIVFVPQASNASFTDPSYHLPAFYKLWAEWGTQDNQFWADAADTSRAFFLRAMHPATGLTTDYMTFEGTPQATNFNSNSDKFAYDSWRVIMNIAMDAHWFGNSGWQQQQTDKVLSFFNSQGPGYKALYLQDGTLTENSHTAAGLIAMNAAGTLASADAIAWDFLSAFYNQPVPTGTYRYYDGLLHMLALLHTSGNFRIYKPGVISSDFNRDSKNTNTIKIYPNPASTVMFLQTEEIQNGSYLVKDLAGKTVLTGSLSKGHSRINVENLEPGIFFIHVNSEGKSVTEKIIIK